MHKFSVSEELNNKLSKLSKKDKILYDRVMKKIKEVINYPNVEHYKNLRYDMKDSKRVQVGHFVLVFRFDKSNNLILFDDLDHHDKVYRK